MAAQTNLHVAMFAEEGLQRIPVLRHRVSTNRPIARLFIVGASKRGHRQNRDMRHDDRWACILAEGLVEPCHLLRVDDGVVAIRCQEDIVDDDYIPATDLMRMVCTLIAKQIEEPLFAPKPFRTCGGAVFFAPSPRVMVTDGMNALDVGVITAGLGEDIPLCSGAGFGLRIGIHDQIAPKQERGGLMFLLHDVVEAERKAFGCAELGLDV